MEPSTKVGETEKMWRPRRVVAGAGAIAYLVPFGASDVVGIINDLLLNFNIHRTKA